MKIIGGANVICQHDAAFSLPSLPSTHLLELQWRFPAVLISAVCRPMAMTSIEADRPAGE